jgi:hypothetical protein
MTYEIKTLISEKDRIPVTDEFITKNKLTLKKTNEEIINKIKTDDSFGSFMADILIDYLDFESVKEFLDEDYIKEIERGEGKYKQIMDIKETAQDFLDYMVFAWGKALDKRGISASRSIIKLSAFMWLLGRDDIVEILNNDDLYNPYGAPALVKACETLGIKVTDEIKKYIEEKK